MPRKKTQHEKNEERRRQKEREAEEAAAAQQEDEYQPELDEDGDEISIPPSAKDEKTKQKYRDAHHQRKKIKKWVESQPDDALKDVVGLDNHRASAAFMIDELHSKPDMSDREKKVNYHYAEKNLEAMEDKLNKMKETVEQNRDPDREWTLGDVGRLFLFGSRDGLK